ncbi:MAG: S-adenosyl-l-methionine hydroxide adenosyltransferase family protein [Dehalococcoidia bacterium]
MVVPPGQGIITLTTDFGTRDPYVGVLKGVVLGINAQATVVDLCHHVQPQAVLQGAFLLGYAHRYFPRGAVHLAVVDPGVGTARRPLLLCTPEHTFVGPDNGIFSYVLLQGSGGQPPPVTGEGSIALSVSKSRVSGLPQGYQAFVLSNPRYWLHPVSQTFHGRDIFAPVAAHLSLGVPPEELGMAVDSVAWLPPPQPREEGTRVSGQVVHVDRFGNLITNIPAGMIRGTDIQVEIKGRRVRGLSASYAEGEGLLAIIGSYGTLELSLRNGDAARLLRAGLGEPVRIDRA